MKEQREEQGEERGEEQGEERGEERDPTSDCSGALAAGGLVASQRQRSRKAHKRKKKQKRDDSGEVLPGNVKTSRSQSSNPEGHSDGVDELESSTEGAEPPRDASIAELFQEELESAKMRLQYPAPAKRPSFGHRAGFDAFMTGYAFAFYVLKQLGDSSVGRSAESMLGGLAAMKNKLANRGKSVPLQIARSHFAKTSEGHRKAWNRTWSMMCTNATPPSSN